MKTSRVPALLCVVLYLALLAYTAYAADQLPDRVATHFNGKGMPNGWMSKSGHVTFMLIFGTVVPAFVALVCFLVRYMPGGLNVPHASYWRRPERRQEAYAYLFQHSLWLSCLLLLFAIGINVLVTRANAQQPPHLASPELLGVLGAFLVGLGWWIVSMLVHFRRTPTPDASGVPPGLTNSK